MKIKFRNYYKEARKTTKKVMKKKENIVKHYMMFIMNLLTFIIYPLRPIYSIANKRLVKNVKDYQDIGIAKSFEAVDKPKIYWTYMICIFTKGFLFLGVLLVHAVLAYLMYILGCSLYHILSDAGEIVLFIFVVPVAVSLVYFLLTIRYKVCPTSYILEGNDNIKTSSALYLSFECTKKSGKFALFLNDLVHLLKLIVVIAIPYAILLISKELLDINVYAPLSFVILFISVIAFFVFEAKFAYVWKLTKYNIYNDLIIDYLAKDTLVSGIKFKEVKQNNNLKETLLSVFENANEFDEKAKKAIDKIPTFGDKLNNVSVSSNIVDTLIDNLKNNNEPIVLVEKEENVDANTNIHEENIQVAKENDIISLSEHEILRNIENSNLNEISLDNNENFETIEQLLGIEENGVDEKEPIIEENKEEKIKKEKKSFFSRFKKDKKVKKENIKEENTNDISDTLLQTVQVIDQIPNNDEIQNLLDQQINENIDVLNNEIIIDENNINKEVAVEDKVEISGIKEAENEISEVKEENKEESHIEVVNEEQSNETIVSEQSDNEVVEQNNEENATESMEDLLASAMIDVVTGSDLETPAEEEHKEENDKEREEK